MKSRIFGLLFLSLCIASCPVLAEPQQNPGYGGADTDAERALDGALKTAQKDKNELDNLFGGRGKPNYRPTVDYSRQFTPELLQKLQSAESAMVAQRCGGKYLPGQVCGFDYDPIRCARGDFSLFNYKTTFNNSEDATISFVTTKQPTQDVRVYKMFQRNGKWRVSGLSCNGSDF